MTPYIQQQLKKLCDNPNWYDDMLISWDKNPRNQREAIYNYLSHVQLNGLLENTQIVFTFIDGYMKPAFYFEIPRDTNRYLILGILDEAGYPHCCLLGQPKQVFSTITDNTDTYDFATFDKEATNGEPPYPVIEIDRKGLAYFMNDDQGYEPGISMYGHYIACKSLDISSEEEYMNQLTDIELICNEL